MSPAIEIRPDGTLTYGAFAVRLYEEKKGAVIFLRNALDWHHSYGYNMCEGYKG
jgi:hypothetical protein